MDRENRTAYRVRLPWMIAKIDQSAQLLTMVWTERFIYFFRPVDASLLAYFRISFGSIMVWVTWRSIQYDLVEYFPPEKSSTSPIGPRMFCAPDLKT